MMRKNLLCIIFLYISSIIIFASDPKTWPQGYYEALYTDTIPVIDGKGNDNCWLKAVWAPINQLWIGSKVNSNDYSGKFKVLWTTERLYVLIEINDDSLRLQDPNTTNVCQNIYNYDCTEIFIDENNSRDVYYANSHKAFAYHMDTSGHVCYANGSFGWERLDDHMNYKMAQIAPKMYHYEYEIKVFDDTYILGGTNVPVRLHENKLMGWSIAYNDNDKGSTRQNMFGSKYIPGNTDNERNISYFNASVFGNLKLVKKYFSNVKVQNISLSSKYLITQNANKIKISCNNSNPESLKINIFNISGKMLIKNTFIDNSSNSNEVDISNLPKGVYFLKINGKKTQEVHKIFK